MKHVLAAVTVLSVSLVGGRVSDRSPVGFIPPALADVTPVMATASAEKPTASENPLASYLDGAKMRDESSGALITAYVSLALLLLGLTVLYFFLRQEQEA